MSNAKQPPNVWAVFVYVAKITVVLPAHTATLAHQTKPPVHHVHRPEHRLRVRPVNPIVIFRPEPPGRTVRARINIRPIVITDALPPKHSPILGECFCYYARIYGVRQFHKKIPISGIFHNTLCNFLHIALYITYVFTQFINWHLGPITPFRRPIIPSVKTDTMLQTRGHNMN